jgi:tetratricopeptide (TPR) repeat protein
MRVTFARTILGLALFVLGTMYAGPSWGQTPMAPDETAGAKQPEQMQETDDAVAYFNKNDFENCEKSLEEAYKKKKDLAPAPFIMAQFFYAAKQPNLFLMYLEKAVQKYPDDPEAYVQLGEVALTQGRIAEGDLLFAKAASVTEKFDRSADRKAKILPRIYNARARIAESREDWPAAQQYLESYLQLEPKNASTVVRIARVLFQQKKIKESIEKLRDAKKLDPEKVLTPEVQLAEFHLTAGDKEKAKAAIAEALKQAPKDLNTLLAATQLMVQIGDIAKAKEYADAAVKADEQSQGAMFLRGLVALFEQDYEGAASILEKAVLKNPDDFSSKNNLALALVECKEDSKKDRAVSYASSNLKTVTSNAAQQNPRQVGEATATYGWVMYRRDPKKNLELADNALQEALKKGANDPDTFYYAARVSFVNKGNSERVKQLLTQALKNTGNWTMKKDAKDLLDQLNK